MNPGYAGRTELPDSMKALFRPIAMTVPDFELIVESKMNVQGVSDSKNLAKKVSSVFNQARDQLSKQSHYDFGMRAINSVTQLVTSIKLKEPMIGDD